jgi:uncharacterized membrane protein YeaQ/YmgE (transglycosylase-associated protein family)
MFNPILASDFEGVEIVMCGPVVIFSTLLGLIAALARIRTLAVFCGLASGGAAAFSLLCAAFTHGNARMMDFICGVVGAVVAWALFHFKRERKDA